MVKCPSCGFDVATPFKTWAIPSRKSASKGEDSRSMVGIYECPNCDARFRAAAETQTQQGDRANLKDMVDRIKGIRGELMQTLKNLREKISTLETERSNLMIEIDSLRKVAETRASALEREVRMMREEVRSLRDLLGVAQQQEEKD